MMNSDLKMQIMESIRKRPAPARGEGALRSTLLLALAAAVPLVAIGIIVAHDQDPRPRSLAATTVCGAIAAAVVAAWIALGRGGRVLGRPRVALLAMAVAAPVVFAVWKLAWSAMYPAMTEAWVERPGARCFALTLIFAAMPFAALAFVRRRSDPTHPGSLGAALGVATAMYASVLVDFWCPVGYVGHVLLGHVLPIALAAALGFAVGRRVFAMGGDR
jgi:hypothetical protein